MSALGLLACPALVQPQDPESQARRALADLAESGVRFEVAGIAVAFPRLAISEVTVAAPPASDLPVVGGSPAALGGTAVLFHVVATGSYGAAALGYYGSERVTLRPFGAFGGASGGAGGLAPMAGPAGGWLPRLSAVLAAVAARDRAVEAGDLGGLARLADPSLRDGVLTPATLAAGLPLAPPAWNPLQGGTLSVRLDGEQALLGLTPANGPPRRAALRRAAGDWRFTSGLL